MSDDLRKRVIRERETEQRIRAMDTHEIVERIHALEDARDELRSEIERLRQALKFYACDCAKLGDECGERLDDVLCGNTARSALKEKENDQ